MAAFYKTSAEVYDEIASKNPKFNKIYVPWKKFREEQVQWFSIAEGRYDGFMAAAERLSQRASAKKK
jgi:TRAP-type mannitol/chloroaromatic compound transport system substrate-binding protein